ncbi:MAG: NifB/NifX family molybdenum-iron cluster-binding protein [Armatimonadota bacterium]
MKVAIASNNERTVAYHLGRAKGFVVAEIEGGEVKGKSYRPVSEAMPVGGARMQMRHGAGAGGHGGRHGRGCCHEEEGAERRRGHGQGAGHGIAVVITLQDCDAVIARGAGTGMMRNLSAAGKKLYLTEMTSVDEALSAFLRGELTAVTTV